MKSLARLLISHVFISIFVTFFLLSGHIEHPFLIIFLLFLPVLNKGQRFQKIQSKKIRLLNASLCFILISFPQLLTNPMDWRYLVFLIICIISSLVYFYTLYQLFKEINHKSYSKSQISLRSWGVFISIPISLFVLSAFHKLFVQHLPLDTFWDNLSQFDKMLPLLVLGLGIGAIFGTMTYAFLSEHEMKHSESGMHKENIEK